MRQQKTKLNENEKRGAKERGEEGRRRGEKKK